MADDMTAFHPNGDCESCGGPCAVYGCSRCPECYRALHYPDADSMVPRSVEYCSCLRCKMATAAAGAAGYAARRCRDIFDAAFGGNSNL